jgi:hypothetical protein
VKLLDKYILSLAAAADYAYYTDKFSGKKHTSAAAADVFSHINVLKKASVSSISACSSGVIILQRLLFFCQNFCSDLVSFSP